MGYYYYGLDEAQAERPLIRLQTRVRSYGRTLV